MILAEAKGMSHPGPLKLTGSCTRSVMAVERRTRLAARTRFYI